MICKVLHLIFHFCFSWTGLVAQTSLLFWCLSQGPLILQKNTGLGFRNLNSSFISLQSAYVISSNPLSAWVSTSSFVKVRGLKKFLNLCSNYVFQFIWIKAWGDRLIYLPLLSGGKNHECDFLGLNLLFSIYSWIPSRNISCSLCERKILQGHRGAKDERMKFLAAAVNYNQIGW